MYMSTFIFAKGDYDDTFYALDEIIANVAKSIPGYLGEESWENSDTGLISNVYYWENEHALEQLMTHPEHVKAKRSHEKWLNGYQVVIAKVVGCYSDNTLNHPLANIKMAFVPKN